jgi:hypothetical protein
VAEDRRRRHEVVRGEQEVGVTEPGRSNLDEDLAPHRRRDVQVLEFETLPTAFRTSARMRDLQNGRYPDIHPESFETFLRRTVGKS